VFLLALAGGVKDVIASMVVTPAVMRVSVQSAGPMPAPR
jgi:hypothetical protein